jgi:hypothetical protein
LKSNNTCRDQDKDNMLSSIDNRGENEFADDESNIVGKSENNSEEDDQKILKRIKKEISKHVDIKT